MSFGVTFGHAAHLGEKLLARMYPKSVTEGYVVSGRAGLLLRRQFR